MSSAAKEKRPVAVVVQTHWDREWYFPHQIFVARLIHVISRVVTQLESGTLQQFLFDGQTAAYEDLLANAEPALVSRVQALVKAKRIVLGPWYVMADEFLVCGESLLRNLELGIADAVTAGNCQYVGYLPDTFGHIGQIPQLLTNFGIHSAVMWRGVDSPVAEFDWQSPDGTRVGALFLTQGYYQHPLNVADWQGALSRYLDSVAARSLATELLLTQGGDHLLSVDATGDRLATFNATDKQYRLTEKSLADHVETVMAQTTGRRQPIRGALRNNKQAFVLPDVLSTRRYLKRLNQDAEDRLLGVIEPLLAQLQLDEYPARYLQDTWRMVIQQQAHDSICGCSVDQVHREMVTRYQLIDQRLNALVDRALVAGGLVSAEQHPGRGCETADVFADDARFTLFNPLPIAFAGTQVISLFLRGEKRTALSLKTSAGEPLHCQLINVQSDTTLRSPIDDFPERLEGHRYEVLVRCEIPGLQALACVIDDATPPTGSSPAAAMPAAIENRRYRIFLDDHGELSITNRLTGQTLIPALSFFSELDAGDSYNFSPPPNQHQVAQTRYSLVSCLALAEVQELVLAVTLTTPQSLSADRAGPSAETVSNTGVLRIRLFEGAPTIDFSLHWTNRASDQRTRLMVALPAPIERTFSDSGFEWVDHPVKYADYPTAVSRQEMPVVVNPSLSTIVAGELVFLQRAMHEYEVLRVNGEQMLGVTLVRSVGWMSRRDLVTRGVGAGPDMATPEAQCLGTEVFEFQIAIGSPTVHPLTAAQRFRRPLVCLRGTTSRWAAGTEINNPNLQISAVRRVGDSLELRLWNPTDVDQSFALSTGQWQRVAACGDQCAGSTTLVKPHEIVTLRCRC
ncbi:MAG: hypothetical protein ACK5YU_06475 [Burkholderiales bacterium]|jgi:mannosylglycerate hydrolase|nr:glycoside hydrolase family 38 [Betaproteobacteria bacterium]